MGGVAPGDGDTAILANGHVVTIAAGTSVTVGNAAAPTTPAIQSAVATGGTGCLIVDTGATLTLKGNVIQGNSTWTVNASATINFLHATANLTWQIADANNQANALLRFAGGTGANRITVQSTGAAPMGGFGWFGVNWSRSGCIDATGVQFTGLGTATLPMLNAQSSATQIDTFTDCLFTSCGQILATLNMPVGGQFKMIRTTIRTPVSTALNQTIEWLLAAGVHTGVQFDTFRWEGTCFIGGASGVSGVTWTNCIGASYGTQGLPLDCTNTPHAATVNGLFLYNTIQAAGFPSLLMCGDIKNLCSMRMFNFNPHAMTIAVTSATVIDTGVWEFGDSDERGDELQIVTNPTVPTPLDVKRIICPICPDGLQAAGAFLNVSLSGSAANNRITQTHCTVGVSMVGATPGGAFTTENNTGGAGMAQAIASNIWYREVLGAGWGVYQVVGVLVADTFFGADYNARWNMIGDGYNPLDLTFGKPDVPGGHDQVVDPQFLDSARRLLSWGKSLISTITTIQQVFDEFFKRNDDAGYDPRFTIDAYIAYMRAGFTPQNPRLYRTGHDETTIGAVAMTLPVPAMAVAVQQRMR